MPIKEATFWVGLTVFGTGLFFWVEGGDRVLHAIVLTIIGIAAAAYAVFAHHYPQLPKIRIWIILLLVTWSAIGYDIFDRYHSGFGYNPDRAWDDAKPLQRIYNQTFTNETVLLDGKLFIKPVFDNVTLLYQGTGPFEMENPTFTPHDGKVKFRQGTTNKIVGESFKLSEGLAAAAGCKGDLTRLPANSPQLSDLPKK